MSHLPLQFTGEDASKAMLEGLTSRIRSELKARILERIEPDVNAAVDAALDGFKGAIESYRDYAQMRDVVQIIIERRDRT
jgi:actin-related protein